MCETPPRSRTMVGMAVETIVWSSAAMSMPASRAEKIRLIRRRVRTIGGGAVSRGGACTKGLRGRSTVPRVRATGGADGVGRSGRSGRWGRKAGGQDVPRLVDEVGERGG